jgi:hypothetical protein
MCSFESFYHRLGIAALSWVVVAISVANNIVKHVTVANSGRG